MLTKGHLTHLPFKMVAAIWEPTDTSGRNLCSVTKIHKIQLHAAIHIDFFNPGTIPSSIKLPTTKFTNFWAITVLYNV